MNISVFLERRFVVLACVLCLLSGRFAMAAEHPAQQRVEAVVDTLVVFLATEQSQLHDDQFLYDNVLNIVGDIVDFDAATKLAVGAPWRQASRVQRQALVSEFSTLLLRVYGSAMREYSGERLEFLPFRAGNREDRAEVRSMLQAASGAVPVSYKLRDKGGWRIYDIIVDSVSLVTTYRNTFATEIDKSGIDGLIESLRIRNGS